MDINKILNSDYLDILFEGRNKKYGGYELRKNYPRRVMKSLLVLAGIGVATAAYAVIANMNKDDNKKVAMIKEVTLAEPPPIDPKKPPPPPPPPEPPPPVKPTVKFTPPVIKKDEEVKEEEKPPEIKELEDKSAGLKTVEGDPDGIDPGIVDPGPGTGAIAAPEPPKIFTYVEQMPEPSVSVAEFLQKNLRYPDLAKENNIQGRVTVRFVVNETGDVSDVQVVKGIGGGCDEEAKRVVMKMPKWKPGKQNGKAVKVYFTLPISFRLE